MPTSTSLAVSQESYLLTNLLMYGGAAAAFGVAALFVVCICLNTFGENGHRRRKQENQIRRYRQYFEQQQRTRQTAAIEKCKVADILPPPVATAAKIEDNSSVAINIDDCSMPSFNAFIDSSAFDNPSNALDIADGEGRYISTAAILRVSQLEPVST